MWYEVQELTKQGLSKSRIHEETGLDRATIRKYQKMEETAFYQWLKQSKKLPKKLAKYKLFVKNLLTQKPYLSAAQIEDRLKEHHKDLPKVHSKTVYNFVMSIREEYEIAKPEKSKPRQFEHLPEVAFGEQSQVDFGEYWMFTKENKRKKVYFFAMVLSRSRYKYIFFTDKPFTTQKAVEAHEKAFIYFEGIPQEILYDQDSVFIHNENLGDYLLTQAFSDFCKTQEFKAVFCRKADPQSKGKVENVVKYVKYNFLRGRAYINIEILNEQALAWLARTGNKKKHSSTQLIPMEEWAEEKKHLIGIKQIAEVNHKKSYKVRKDNTVCYKSNFYSLPSSTYKDKESRILLEIIADEVKIYSLQEALICSHNLSMGKGQYIRNTDHQREKSKTLEEYHRQVSTILGQTQRAGEYLKLLRKDKSRYYRDNLQYIIKHHEDYADLDMEQILLFCIENKILNGQYLIDILNKQKRERKKEAENSLVIKPVENTEKYMTDKKYNELEKSNIEQYEKMF